MVSKQQKNNLTFSVIIPAWPQEGRPFGLDYLDKLDFPPDCIEVIIARGYSPCKQRNHAARQAKGDILVFFDNDSCPQPDYLNRLLPHFSNPDVAGVGGPNPALPVDKYIPNLVDAVFTSRIAVLSKYARYKPVGQLRKGSDSDFIFCNFALRRELYLQLDGLDERLCPNEENEFFERFSQRFPDRILLYDPQVIALEPRPQTIRSFLRKMFGYGKGRSRQFKIRPSLWSSLHLLGCLALVLPVIFILTWGFWPLLFLVVPYGALLLMSTINSLLTNNRRSIALGIAPATFATHVAYVLGLWKGLFESTNQPSRSNTPVKIEYHNIPKSKRVE